MDESPLALVVDDDETARYASSHMLRRAGYRVLEAGTGEEALRLARRQPDIVVLDVNLPDMSGFDVCRILRSEPQTSRMPILQISASFTTVPDKVKGLENGADIYLTHPIEPSEFLATVRTLLRARRAEESALRASREWSATFNALRDGICLIDAEGNIERCNEAMADLFNTSQEALHGQAFALVADAAWHVPEIPPLMTARRTHTRETEEVHLGERWYQATAEPVPTEDVEDRGVVLVLADITTRRQASENAARHQAQIQTLNERLKLSMRETHHRVKNNLQIVAAMIEYQTLNQGTVLPVSEFKRLGQHVRSLAAIHDLLTREPGAEDVVGRISSQSILDRLAPMLRSIQGDRQLRLDVDHVLLSARQASSLALVTNELVSNAVKHSDGSVDIVFRRDPEGARLIIMDDGPGFPPGFDPATASNTGLEIVCRVSQWDLRGTVEFANRPTGGAMVTVFIAPPPEEDAA